VWTTDADAGQCHQAGVYLFHISYPVYRKRFHACVFIVRVHPQWSRYRSDSIGHMPDPATGDSRCVRRYRAYNTDIRFCHARVKHAPLVADSLASEPVAPLPCDRQGSFLKALPPSDVLANRLPLIAIAIVTLSLAAWIVRRRL
jgi:hypothetical protein